MSQLDKKIAECERHLRDAKTQDQKQHYKRLISFYKQTKRRMKQ